MHGLETIELKETSELELKVYLKNVVLKKYSNDKVIS